MTQNWQRGDVLSLGHAAADGAAESESLEALAAAPQTLGCDHLGVLLFAPGLVAVGQRQELERVATRANIEALAHFNAQQIGADAQSPAQRFWQLRVAATRTPHFVSEHAWTHACPWQASWTVASTVLTASSPGACWSALVRAMKVPYLPVGVSLSTALCLLGFVGSGCQSSRSAGLEATPRVGLRAAPRLQFRGANSADPGVPGDTDCNSPAHWDGGTLYLFNSAGHPWRSSGSDLYRLHEGYQRAEYNNTVNGGRWIECTWKADDGKLFGWYHLEPGGVCPGKPLTAPRIGAVRSRDNGSHWEDLGIVIEAPPDTLRCDTRNRYFAGGNGDFSVMLDEAREFLYFFVSTYTGSVSEQGVAVARLRWADRDQPIGRVWKWHDGQWHEPGLGGRVSAAFPARVDWHRPDADAFWGPSVHWNSYLRHYVMLLNRAQDGEWTQEGIYVSFTRDLANPACWTVPRRILDAPGKDRWYPQVIGVNAARRETDKLAGRRARLFVRGESRWEIRFLKPGERD